MDYLNKQEDKRQTSEEEEVHRSENRIRLEDGRTGSLTELLNSSCGDCNRHLEWEASYDSINKYIPISFIAKHCRRIYSISGFQTGVRVTTVSDEEARNQVETQKSKRQEKDSSKKQEEQKNKELEKQQDTKDLSEIQKQGFNIDKEGGQTDVLKAQKNPEVQERRMIGIADKKAQESTLSKITGKLEEEVNK